MEKHGDWSANIVPIRHRFSLLIALIHHFMEHYHRHDRQAWLSITSSGRTRPASTAGQFPPPIHLPSRQSQPLSDLSRSIASRPCRCGFSNVTRSAMERKKDDHGLRCARKREDASYVRERVSMRL